MLGSVDENGCVVGRTFKKGEVVWITVDCDGVVQIHWKNPILSPGATFWMNDVSYRLLLNQNCFNLPTVYTPKEPIIWEYVI